MSQDYQWFLEPHDDGANEMVVRYLNDCGEGGDENKIIGLQDSEGESHDVWQVPHRVITMIRNSGHLWRFTVLNRRGNHGQVRVWQFEKKTALSAVKRGLVRA